MSWALTTSGAAISEAGAGANSTIIASSATLAKWSDEAEGELNTDTRYDWVANIGSVSANYKPILSQAISVAVGNKILKYDPSGYTSRYEAQFIADMNSDIYNKCVNTLTDMKNKEKMI